MEQQQNEHLPLELSSQLVSIMTTEHYNLQTGVGVVAFLVSVGIHQRYQWGQWMRLGRNLPVLFPSQPGE